MASDTSSTAPAGVSTSRRSFFRPTAASWADISGNLPDVPGDDLVMWHGKLVLATDHLVYVTDAATPGHWARLGSGLPHTVAADLTLYPSGSDLVVATHGRGIWRISRS